MQRAELCRSLEHFLIEVCLSVSCFFAIFRSIHGHSDRSGLDHANTVTAGGGSNTDVATLTPVGAPRVSHNPVVLTRLRVLAPTNHGHGVINRSRALISVENTALIVHEVVVSSGDSNRKDLSLKSSLPFIFVIGLDSSVLLSSNRGGVGSIILAGLLATLVFVISLLHHVLLVGVFVEDVGHEAAIASIVAFCCAIDELLLGQAVEGAGVDGVETFHLGVGGESPA